MNSQNTPEPQGFPHPPQSQEPAAYAAAPVPTSSVQDPDHQGPVYQDAVHQAPAVPAGVALAPAPPQNFEPQPPLYDEVTPGEPAAYVVPAEYRRPLGETPRDKRGKFWIPAFASGISAAASVLVFFTPFALYGINIVAALAAIVLGIRALYLVRKNPRTSYSGKARLYSWLGIGVGALNLIITTLALVGIIAFFSWMQEETCNELNESYDSQLCEDLTLL